jgi:hypothetical protein
LALLNQDGDKVLVGLELDALRPPKHTSKTLLVGGCVCEKANPENSDGSSSVQHTVNQYTP